MLSPREGEILDERFRVIRRLGRGGAATVLEVEHTITGQRRAMKILHPEQARSGADLARFVREARILAKLNHPGIPAIHDAGRLRDGSTYLLMDLLDGADLDHLLAARGPLPVPEAVALTVAILRAIGAAHREGVVHRDLKPENVFVMANGGGVQLIDFGVAARLAGWTDELGRLTKTDALVGTPAYMAPEAIGGRAVDGRADLYGVGAILFRMLEGRPRFEGSGLVDLLGRIASGRGNPITRSDVPPALREVIERSMSVDPSARPADALAFEQALGHPTQRATEPLAREVVHASPPSSASVRQTSRGLKIGCGIGVLGVGLATVALAAAVTMMVGDGGHHAPSTLAERPGEAGEAPRFSSAPRVLSGFSDCDRFAIAYCRCHPSNCGTGYDPVEPILRSYNFHYSDEEQSEIERACDASFATLDTCVPMPVNGPEMLRDYDFDLPECREYVRAACRCDPLACDENGNHLTRWEVMARPRRTGVDLDDVEDERRHYCTRALELTGGCPR